MIGKTDVLSHPILFNLGNCDDPDTLNRIKKFKPKKLKAEEVIGLGIAGNIVNPIADDLARQNFYTNFFSSHYLTNRTMDAHFFEQNQRKTSVKKSRLMTDALQHKLPFVENAKLEKLIQLRRKEGEAHGC
jgi:hypothetical protein